jgi:hypothetical protein
MQGEESDVILRVVTDPGGWAMSHAVQLSALLLLLLTVPVSAEITLPPGFTIQTYLTGQGFDSIPERGLRGIPTMFTIAFDPSGTLYLNRIGARFRQGEAEDLLPIYRVPPGKTTMTGKTEKNFLYGPPLLNPRVSGGVAPGEVFVTTYDRDRKLGALYRIKDGRASLFAGGTPPSGGAPLFKNPEGVAFDSLGNIYVADRDQGVVIKLDPAGRPLNSRFATGLGRVGPLAIEAKNTLWVGSDGTAQTPFQDGSGQIWKVGPDGSSTLVLQGPLPSGLSVSPGGALFAAQRRAGRIFFLTPEGREIDFANSTDESTIRALAFAPITPATVKAGFGGDLFVVTSPRVNFAISEVVRISGPFDEFVQRHMAR